MRDLALTVDRDYAFAYAVQDGRKPVPLNDQVFDIALECAGEHVEGLRKVLRFKAAADFGTNGEIALRHLQRGIGNFPNGLRQRANDEEGRDQRQKQHAEQHEAESERERVYVLLERDMALQKQHGADNSAALFIDRHADDNAQLGVRDLHRLAVHDLFGVGKQRGHAFRAVVYPVGRYEASERIHDVGRGVRHGVFV